MREVVEVERIWGRRETRRSERQPRVETRQSVYEAAVQRMDPCLPKQFSGAGRRRMT